MNVPKGYYRQLLTDFPNVRIAFTDRPIIGCSKIDSQPIITALELSDDPHAKYYSEGLKDGSMVAIVEGNPDRHFAPGELYFKT